MSRNEPPFTVEEIIEILKRSDLDNVVIEGHEDTLVYRALEGKINGLSIYLIPAGGRDKVLQIFRRRSELPPSCKVVFIADKDTWIYGGVPISYRDPKLIFTEGYSIENDVFRDGAIEDYLHGKEKVSFATDLALFIVWYSITARRHLISKKEEISTHPNRILDQSADLSQLLRLNILEPFPTTFYGRIKSDPYRLLRGKSLMAIAVRYLSASKRFPKHNSASLMDSTARRPGPLLDRIYRDVQDGLK